MNAQVPFPAAVYHNGTSTSREAARLMLGHVSEQQARVLAALRAAPDGLIRDEVADAARIPLASACARAKALLEAGLVYERGTRPTENGIAAKVLRAVRS